jgi:ABC-type uncharacterized transport system permease subunit
VCHDILLLGLMSSYISLYTVIISSLWRSFLALLVEENIKKWMQVWLKTKWYSMSLPNFQHKIKYILCDNILSLNATSGRAAIAVSVNPNFLVATQQIWPERSECHL